MDELVAFLVEELAMDGESGTDKDRFIGFIKVFHRTHRNDDDSSTSPVPVDDAYIDYVWSLVLQHPTVHVGVRQPPIKKTDDARAFAPKGGKKKRDGAKEMSSKIDTVRLLPRPQHPHTFRDLYRKEHGDEVRIVLDEDFVRLKLTGTAIKDFLVPNYYATLQLIARAREKALPSSEICRILGYPPTTVFSFLKALIELDLITKFQAHETGNTGNLLLHRRYRGLNETYLAQQMAARETAELGRARASGGAANANANANANDAEADSDDDAGQASVRRDVPSERTIDFDEQESVADIDEEGDESQTREGGLALSSSNVVKVTSAFHGMLAFPTMSRQRALAYLSSTALVRARILTLLFASTNHIVTKARLWDRLGFPATWNRSERKSFLEAVRKLIATGLIEPVRVDVGSGKLLACHRLTPAGVQEAQRGEQSSQDRAARHEQQELELLAEKSTFAYKAHVPYERQVLECVKRTGAHGVTTNQIRDEMHFSRGAKRHLDEYLSARVNDAEDGTPDFSIHMGQENVSRERRNRWRCRLGLVQKHQELQQSNDNQLRKVFDQLDPIPPGVFDGFTSPPEEITWSSLNELSTVLKSGVVPVSSRAQQTTAAASIAPTPKKGKKSYVNPIDPETGTPKRGRPRKDQNSKATPRGTKRKAQPEVQFQPQAGADSPSVPPPQKRGRADEMPSAGDGEASSSVAEPAAAFTFAAATGAMQSPEGDAGVQAAETSRKHRRPEDDSPPPSPAVASGQATPVAGTARDRTAATQGAAGASTSTPSAKRPRKTVTVGPRVNFSMEKRMATFLELLDANGGVIEDMTIAKKYDAFVAEKFGGRNEEAEAFTKEVDFRDTKGRGRLYAALEARGDIKTTTTMVAMKKGAASAKRRIVYKADLDPSVLQKFVQDVMEGRAGYNSGRAAVEGSAAPPSLIGKNIGQVAIDSAEMVAHKPEAILSQRPVAELLADPNTRVFFAELAIVRSQPYGLIPGEMARLRYLHQEIMARFEAGEDGCRGVVSADKGIFDVDWFIQNCALDLYCKLKPIGRELAELLEALSDPARRKLPMCEQTLSIRSSLDHQNQIRTRSWFDKFFFHRFSILGLAIPVERQGDDDNYLEAAPDAANPLFHLKFSTWTGGVLRIPEQLRLSVQTAADVDKIWAELSAHGESYGRQVSRAKRAGHPCAQYHADTLRSLAVQMENRRGWFSNFQLVQRQSRFLHRFLSQREDRHDVDSLLQDRAALQTVSNVIMAPMWVIEAYIERHATPRPRHDTDVRRQRRPGQQHPASSPAEGGPADDLDAGEGQTLGTAAQAQRRRGGRRPKAASSPLALLSPEQAASEEQRRKARAVAHSRQADWEDAFDDICHAFAIAGEKRAKLDDALATIRSLYVEGSAPLTLQMIRTMVAAAIRGKPDEAVARPTRAEAARKSGEEVVSGRRRKRPDVTWNRRTDELLRDACVILTARDRYRATSRSNWSALQQIFPDVNPTTLRARFTRLSSAVGEEAYLMQLEKEWTRLWEAFRGTVILPDDDPKKSDAFDLTTHIEFLRMHVDKDEVLDTVERSAAVTGLPASVDDLAGEWVLRDTRPVQALLDVVHDPETSVAIAARKEALVSHSIFLQQHDADAEAAQTCAEDDMGLERAQAAVKMCIETPEDAWSESAAVELCDFVGAARVEEACQTLLDAKIIRSALPEGRRLPGRNFVYSEDFQRSSAATSFKIDKVCREAASAHRALARRCLEGQRQLTLTVGANNTPGETVVLAELLCAAQAAPRVDLSQLDKLRDKQMFNAKTIIDQDVEVFIDVQLPLDFGAPDTPEWEYADLARSLRALDERYGALSAPREGDDDAAWEAAAAGAAVGNEEVHAILRSLRSDLERAGPAGLRTADLERLLASYTRTPGSALAPPLTALTLSLCSHLARPRPREGTTPCAFIAGYDAPRLISSSFLSAWCVPIPVPVPVRTSTATSTTTTGAAALTAPRAWKTLTGGANPARFARGMHQLLNAVLVRSGATRARLCEVMRRASAGGWDRMEVCDLLWALGRRGHGERALPSVEFRVMRVRVRVHERGGGGRQPHLSEETLRCEDVAWEVLPDEEVYVVPLAGSGSARARSWWRELGEGRAGGMP